MDLYIPPAGSVPAPTVIMIHGGAWRAGDRSELPRINQYLASRGYLVAAIDYRLAPACRFPAALEDVRAAIAYLKENAAMLNLDSHQIVLMGRSAGGHLVLLEGYTANDPSIRGVVAIYPPADLVYAYEHPSNPNVLDSTAVLKDFLGGSPDLVSTAYHDCSPVNFITAASPPTLLIHGAHDDIVYVLHSERIDQRLCEVGVQHYFLRIPWGNHGCDANLNGPGGQLSVYAIERFLAAVFK
jgi:acetyl esterase/lipase